MELKPFSRRETPERTPEQQAAIDRAKNLGRRFYRDSLNLRATRPDSEKIIPHHARMGVTA